MGSTSKNNRIILNSLIEMNLNFQVWVGILLYCLAARPILSQYSGAFLVKEAHKNREKFINNIVQQELKREKELSQYAPAQTKPYNAPTYNHIYDSKNKEIQYNAKVRKTDELNYLSAN